MTGAWPRTPSFASLATALFALAGCGSDTAAATLVLLFPEAGEVLTMADDEDPDTRGLQVTVQGDAERVNPGTQVDLYVVLDEEAGPLRQAVSGLIGPDGRIELADSTLPPGTHRIFLRTSTGSLSSDEDQQYTFRALEITSPTDGEILRLGDDEDLDVPGVQVSVSVQSHAIDPSEEIALLVDGNDGGLTATSGADGVAVVEKVTLAAGEHTLEAILGSGPGTIRSEPVTVDVRETCAEIDFLSPRPPVSGTTLTLGGEGPCPADAGDPFQVTVEISTDAGDGQPVKLSVNDREVASGTVAGASVTFEGVELTNLASPNSLKVEVQNEEGVWCPEEFPVDLLVDCAGPDCTIAAPTPVSYLDASDALTLYLNAGHERNGAFDIDIETDAPGQAVVLIVDGKTRDAPEATSTNRNGSALARFRGVALAEGAHTIEARCVDAEGNPNYTGEVTWVVDTAACDVTVTAPAADTAFVPADDDDTNAANGTQVVLTSTVGGGDCAGQRAAPCDPASGIPSPGFVFYDGASPLLSTLTLDAASAAQTLCVEIQDRAENIGRGTLDVRYIGTAPSVLIENPADGETFNVLGSGEHSPDADPTSPVSCDADFSIACTELGEEVELHHGTETGLVFATATCTAPGTGDPPLPTGYTGRAEIRAFFEDGDDTAVVVATQTIVGTTGAELVGVSAQITIQGDCSAPTPSLLDNPCESGFIESSGPNVIKEVRVFGGASDVVTVTLDVLNDDGTTSSDSVPDDIVNNVHRFAAVDLGGEGALTLTATAEDDFQNQGTAVCMADIVSDVPTLVVSAPLDDEVFGVGDGCDAGGMYGVQVTAMADSDVNRSASISVDGVPIVPAPTVAVGGAISECVAVPDGAVTITVRVDSELSTAFREVSVNIVVASTAPSSTTEIVLTPACPDPASPTYREDLLTLDWDDLSLLEDWPGQFDSYVLRCAHTPASDETSAQDWWDNVASDVALGAPPVTPQSGMTEAGIPYRVGETRHCALRASDAAGELTPVGDSVEVSCGFREAVLYTSPTDTTSVGVDAAAVGDVNDDGIDDLLVGGNGQAYLFFGRTGVFPGSPDVTFTGSALLGNRVTALGDFNGDSYDDFAIAWHNHITGSRQGQVFVFFGRPAARPWPASVNLTVTCGADLCLKHLDIDASLGNAISSAGDFDDDGRPDLAAAATRYPANTNVGRLYIVRGASYETRACANDGECRAVTETCGLTTGVCELVSDTFWGLDYQLPLGSWLNAPTGTPVTLQGFVMDGGGAAGALFGNGLAALGAFDATDGEDMVVSAPGAGQLFFLSGHPYTAGSGFEVLTSSRLGFRDGVGGTPSGMAFETQTTNFGLPIAVAGNVYDVPGATNPGARDLLAKRATDQGFYLYPGDNDFDPSERILIDGPSSSDTGIRMASGFHPALPSVTGDFDGDGYEEVCAAGNRVLGVPPGAAYLWYADAVATEGADGSMSYLDGSRVDPPASTATGERVVRYAGDVTGDGHPDIVVGDWEAVPAGGTLRGEATLLY